MLLRASAAVIEPETMTTVAVWSAPLVALLVALVNVVGNNAGPGEYASPIDEAESYCAIDQVVVVTGEDRNTDI